MRGSVLAAVIALGAAAAPAQAADVKIQNFSFMPASITIGQGDSVTWTWAGPDTNHSVTAGASQADSWDSDPGKTPSAISHIPGSTFSHTFNTPGTFTYLCKVHSFMTGKVVVNGPGGGPPADTTAPALSKVSTTGGRKCKKGQKKCKGRPTTLRFKLSEAATVSVKVPKHKAANVTRAGKAGSNTISFSTSKLPPGKWTLDLSATDSAGNTSPVKPVKVTVKKG
ncbi:MAG TPA: plastocyanin/azurin family copper-binding protein [Thermoleophilaceae bacterium]|jgi:plastocyanin